MWEVLRWRVLTEQCSQSSRPGEVDSDPMETLIENNQRSITQELANILQISKSVVIGENGKWSYFMGKKSRGLFGQPTFHSVWGYP